MQILADRIEFCWIHLRGIGTLENSLWGYDGQGIRVWLNALAIESTPSASDVEDGSVTLDRVKESVNIPLDFYPLCEYTPVSVTRRGSTRNSGAHGQGDHHRRGGGSRNADKLVFHNVQTCYKRA